MVTLPDFGGIPSSVTVTIKLSEPKKPVAVCTSTSRQC